MMTLKHVGDRGEPLAFPEYATAGASGLDLRSDVTVSIPIHQRCLVPTGLAIQLPPDTEGQIRGRSGLAFNHGIDVILGTIDNDYRGELGVLMVNNGPSDYLVKRGDRIAQLVISPVCRVRVIIGLNELAPTPRGENGFGSTGVR